MLVEPLTHVREDRRDAVRAWLEGSLKDCAACGFPVRPVDPRKTGKEGLQHLDCSKAPMEVAEAGEPVSAAVAARARRSDWG